MKKLNRDLQDGMKDVFGDMDTDAVAMSFSKGAEFTFLDIDKITVEPQVRSEIDTDSQEFKALVNTIKQKGILQPLLIEKHDGAHKLLAGERRLRAAEAAGLTRVPVRIRDGVSSPADRIEIQLIENLSRKSLDPIDEAKAYVQFYGAKTNRNQPLKGLLQDFMSSTWHDGSSSKLDTETISVIETISGKTMRSVANLLSLLTLPEDLQQAIKSGKVATSHGYIMAANLDHKEFAKIMGRLINGDAKLTRDNLREAFSKATQEKKGGRPAIPFWKYATDHFASMGKRILKEEKKLKPDDIKKIEDAVKELQGVLERVKAKKG